MNKVMFSVEEITKKINQGDSLLLAGDEHLLKQLPKGNWIGGTIPYFMSHVGGLSTQEKIYGTKLPEYVIDTSIRVYDEDSIKNVYIDEGEMDFSFIIMPAGCSLHFSFALNAHTFEGFATHPLIGWISGVHLDDLGKIKPLIFDGSSSSFYENKAVVIHVKIPESHYAEVNIINIFEQGDGDSIIFSEDGFSAKEALINGRNLNFAKYIKENKIDTRLPLVADYSGAMINTSFQNVDEKNNKVDFYAPIFKGFEYKLAQPIEDYISKFINQIPKDNVENIIFACNCILNYLYSELEGKKTGEITGPITFGEIAYTLVNQTLAYLTINKL
ncbi:MAG: hypothetical protein GF353_07905 [Candidatus Lokiarchaeota archaeon]|nr:hypothetical protein [Candidatus Lokiarchaeota archaeon]